MGALSPTRRTTLPARRPATVKRSRSGAGLKSRAQSNASRRELREDIRQDCPLRIDRERCIIYGVKVLGRISKNTHDADVECTEYSTLAMQKALSLYENTDVCTDHPEDRKNPGQGRSVYETFGKLRKCRIEKDGIRADLHYNPAHELSESVLKDIELGLGNFGLSHNARAGRESIRNGRLVIEEIVLVRSVDLVTKPATNRNLWESHRMATTTLRKQLSKKARQLKGKSLDLVWDLLEDDAMPMDEPVDDVGSDPDSALRDAFIQSGSAVLAAIFNGEIDMAAGMSKIKDMANAHGKLSAKAETVTEEDDEEEEPDGDEVEEADDTDDDKKDDKDKEEAEDCDDDKKEKKESYREKAERLERREKARNLCEAEQVIPTAELLEALEANISDKAKKAIVTQFKSTGSAESPRKPRSVPSGRNVNESQNKNKATTGTWLNRLR